MFEDIDMERAKKKIAVRYMVFPATGDGVSGFYAHENDKRCVEPSKTYTNGVCHTIGDELDELASRVGFQTREEFARGMKNWKDAYAKALSAKVGEVLESEGLEWEINGEKILFYCPKEEFVIWPKKLSEI